MDFIVQTMVALVVEFDDKRLKAQAVMDIPITERMILMKANMSQQILTALIALTFMVLLALIFSGILMIPKEVVEFLKTAVFVPALSALLMAWKAWTTE